MKHPARTPAARDAKREEFPDGSALVTYADGGMLIVETDLSREAVLQDSRSVNYNDPPPPPPANPATNPNIHERIHPVPIPAAHQRRRP